MKLFKNKVFEYSLIFLFCFLININNINAAPSYKMTETENKATDIINNTNRTDQYGNYPYDDLIICSYGCADENIGETGGKCGSENSSFSTISYYIKNSPLNKWKIEMNMLQQINQPALEGGNKVSNLNFVWLGNGNIIPSKEIYFGLSKSGNVNESWEKTDAYKNLQNSFTCPQYLYYDTSLGTLNQGDFKVNHNSWFTKDDNELVLRKENDMEICYANSSDMSGCTSRNEKDKTTFTNPNSLNYSFTKELSTVLDNTNNDINSITKEQFMLRYYENEDGICSALKSNDGNGFTETLADENMINFINQSFKTHASNSINRDLYTYEIISTLNKDIKSLSYEGNSLNNKIDDIKNNYKNKFDESFDYYLKKCDIPDDVANKLKEEASSSMSTKITKLEKKITDDFERLDETPLDCETLFSGMADLISSGYFIIEILGIILLVALTILDYAKVIFADSQDAMKKSNQKLLKRVIIVIVLLLLPALVNLVLRVFNIEGFNSENPLCVKIKK